MLLLVKQLHIWKDRIMSSLFECSTRANEAEEARLREEAKRIRCSSSGGSDGSFSLRGARPEELEMLRGMVENRFWVSVNDQGRLERHYKLADCARTCR